MKINWKARFKNKAFVIAFITLIITFVYQLMSLFEIVPKLSESGVINFFTMLVNFIAMCGTVNDPTTKGLYDSDRAMTYYTDEDVRNEEVTEETTYEEVEG